MAQNKGHTKCLTIPHINKHGILLDGSLRNLDHGINLNRVPGGRKFVLVQCARIARVPEYLTCASNVPPRVACIY